MDDDLKVFHYGSLSAKTEEIDRVNLDKNGREWQITIYTKVPILNAGFYWFKHEFFEDDHYVIPFCILYSKQRNIPIQDNTGQFGLQAYKHRIPGKNEPLESVAQDDQDVD